MANEKVSIIIPMYNSEMYIEDCIRSCLAQTHENVEIIIVDDASTDSSFDVAMNFVGGKVHLFRNKENGGFVVSRNRAIRESTGEYIVPIDSDDMLTPDSIAVRLSVLRSKTTLKFVHGLVYDDVPENATYQWCLENRDRLAKSKRTRRQFTNQHKDKIHAQGMMFRRTVFQKYGLYHNILSKADKEMTYRLGIHPNSPFPPKVKYKKIQKFVAFYRRRDDSMKSSLDEEKKKALKIQLNERMMQLKTEGLTAENTEWL